MLAMVLPGISFFSGWKIFRWELSVVPVKTAGSLEAKRRARGQLGSGVITR